MEYLEKVRSQFLSLRQLLSFKDSYGAAGLKIRSKGELSTT
jgi:hypothetical protein